MEQGHTLRVSMDYILTNAIQQAFHLLKFHISQLLQEHKYCMTDSMGNENACAEKHISDKVKYSRADIFLSNFLFFS